MTDKNGQSPDSQVPTEPDASLNKAAADTDEKEPSEKKDFSGVSPTPVSPQPFETKAEPAPNASLTVNLPSPENLWAELAVAFNYLTRFRLPFQGEPQRKLIRKAMGWFPLVGAFVGLLGGAVDWIMTQMHMSGLITASFAVIAMLWATRALHEEELATLVNDYGKNTEDNKVGWLKEERAIRYGTLAVILLIIIKVGIISNLGDTDNFIVFQALLAAGSWSRALMVVMAAWLRPLPDDPVADHFQQPPGLRVALALGLGAVLVFACLGEDTATALIAGTIAGLIVALIGANHLRGYNGPLLGTLQQVVEITVLGVVLAVQ